ncbi:outer membrane beta-barrel protein [Flavobacterium columnare]|uniref:Porin family protein n=1 Tax=Flavobacterium columnare TaxID=996 RepID=A0AAI8GAF5_9FLAO|nr:outer membrane beta-barrel protein [Flavobacterium columnare]AMO19834.1 porin family protein [Flavobacterium columnare]AUX17772.1 hypothetical protein AQ623_05380 [Flavobacterium columnare]MEB3800633.1 outer membrane beta-barrel protein [Flavobacterium columnare]QOG56831.1 outer membrane beta-barrel protein [Flavobacterium columnare]QOG59556.1 outer membrane beta-barrel protein [Flavobacterium columnare]
MSLIVLLSSFFSTTAQEKGTSELRISYGIVSTNGIINTVTNILTAPASLGTIEIDNKVSTGVFTLEYNYAILNKLNLGLDLAYETFESDILSNGKVINKQNEEDITLALKSNYNYLSNDNFRLYSGLGVGYTLIRNKTNELSSEGLSFDNSNRFNFQITGIGFRYGKKLGISAEVGLGYKGILNGGISYQF